MDAGENVNTIQPLGSLDALFLHLESAQMPMHVGSMHQYEVAARRRRGHLERVRKGLSQRLHLSPVFTRRLVQTPLNLTNPAWIDDPEVDITYHVRGVALPAPGTLEQFEACVADLHSRLMDRGRPLWEVYVISGLANGMTGVYCKVHHAAIDGKAGVVLAQAMLDLVPDPPPVTRPDRRAPPARPEAAALLKTALARQAKLSGQLLRLLPDLARAGSQAASGSVAERIRALIGSASGRSRRDGLPVFAPRTPFNVSIDGARAIATAQVTLVELKGICAALGGTINDAVLAICSGGLRRYLQAHGALPPQPLIAAIPVSLRAEGDKSQNTQATMYRSSIATHLEGARERYDAICEASQSMKKTVAGTKALIPMDFPSLGMPWLLPGLAALYGRTRVADRISPVVNLVISNVPGPQVPLYMSGARMLTYHPLSIVTHGLALNVTVESYDGTLYFGLVACRRAVPDLGLLATAMGEARDELLALAAPGKRKRGGDLKRPSAAPRPARPTRRARNP